MVDSVEPEGPALWTSGLGDAEPGAIQTASSRIRFCLPVRFKPDAYDALAESISAVRWVDSEGERRAPWKRTTTGKEVGEAQDTRRGKEAVLSAYAVESSIPRVQTLFKSEAGGWGGTLSVFAMAPECRNSDWGLGQSAQWALWHGAREVGIPFQITGMELVLSRDGVLQLIVDVRSPSNCFEDWLDLCVELRKLRGGHNTRIRVATTSGTGGTLLGGRVATNALHSLRPVLEKILEELLPGNPVRWWKADLFAHDVMLPWVYLSQVPMDDEGHEPRMAALTHMQGSLHLSNLEMLSPPGGERFVLGGGEDCAVVHGVLAMIQNREPSAERAAHRFEERISREYGLMVLLAWHQRFAIERLATGVTEGWGWHSSTDDRAPIFDALQSELMAFMAHGRLERVFHKHRMQQFFTFLRSQWTIEDDYSRLAAKVNELEHYTANKRSLEFENTVKYAGVFVGFAAIPLGFYGVNNVGFGTPSEGLDTLRVLAVTFGAGTLGLLGLFTYSWLRKR